MHMTRRAPGGTRDRGRRGGPEAAAPLLDLEDERARSGDEEPRGMELPPPRETLLGRAASWKPGGCRRCVPRSNGHAGSPRPSMPRSRRSSAIPMSAAGCWRGLCPTGCSCSCCPLAFFVIAGLGLLASAFGTEPNLISNSAGMAGVVTKQLRTRPAAPRAGGSHSRPSSCSSGRRGACSGRSRSFTRWHGSARRPRSRCAGTPSGSSRRHSPANSCWSPASAPSAAGR